MFAWYTLGVFILGGDFTLVGDLRGMYAHCKATEDKDMNWIDFITDHGDDPNLQYVHVVSAAMRSPMSYSQHPDKRIDDLFERQKRAIDPAERKKLTREFEQYSISQAYNIMLFWWQRIVVHNKRVKGWQLTPSRYLGNDLTAVWLDK